MSVQTTKSITEKATKRLQLCKDGKSKIVCRSIWLRITNEVPEEFRNNKLFSDTKVETMSNAQIKRVIENLPTGVETIGIAGGEPFTTPNLLRTTLETIQERGFPNLTQTTVQTIGYWATDRKKTTKTLKELIALGVNHFNVYGAGLWNLEQGVTPTCQKLLYDILHEEFGAVAPQTISKLAEVESLFTRNKVTFSYRANGFMLPGSSAKQQSPRKNSNSHSADKEILYLRRDGYIFTINVNGDVYYANNLSSSALGNIFELPLTKIVTNARHRRSVR